MKIETLGGSKDENLTKHWEGVKMKIETLGGSKDENLTKHWEGVKMKILRNTRRE